MYILQMGTLVRANSGMSSVEVGDDILDIGRSDLDMSVRMGERFDVDDIMDIPGVV